jgi:hypothetical protein
MAIDKTVLDVEKDRLLTHPDVGSVVISDNSVLNEWNIEPEQ